jgi:hypothetical protein
MSTGGGLGAILGGMQVDPTRLRRGLGDALMGIGAIGLGQDPFAVMQAQRQGRREEERTQIEDQRYDQEWGMKKDQFDLTKRKTEIEIKQEEAREERRILNEKKGERLAIGLFPDLAMQVAHVNSAIDQAQQTNQQEWAANNYGIGQPGPIAPMGGGQARIQDVNMGTLPQGQGLAPAMGGAPQGSQRGLAGAMQPDPNLTPQELQVLQGLAQSGDYETLAAKHDEFLLTPAEKPGDLDNLIIRGPDGKPMINELALEAKRLIARDSAARNTTEIKLPAEETEYDKEMGKTLAGEYVGTQKAGAQAATQAEQYRQLGDALAATYTGVGGKSVLQLKRLAQAAGFDVEGVAPAQLAQKISRELALTLRNPESGAGMPGQLSNADRDYLESMVPGLETSPEGNKLMVDYMIRLAERKEQVAAEARKYAQANGGRLDANWYTALQQYVDANPLFTDQDLAAAQAAAAGGDVGGGPELSDEELINKYK